MARSTPTATVTSRAKGLEGRVPSGVIHLTVVFASA